MTIKNCTCCKKALTTKNAKFIGRMAMGDGALLFNCPECKSTVALPALKKLKAA